MERIEVIERAAAALWARHPEIGAGAEGGARVARLCAALNLETQVAPASDVMLGGAYSRLQLWDCGQTEKGGLIWLRENLDTETRTFALAHELGHYALHRGEGINVRPACDEHEINQQADPASLRTAEHRVEEYTPRARRELEANAFAAELLAPRAEVRRLFAISRGASVSFIAARFGISLTLAERRLIDAVLAPGRPTRGESAAAAHTDTQTDTNAAAQVTPGELIERLDALQREAARTVGPALVVAGPGTGKTATLVGRVAHLVAERGIPPEKVLALTFSNRAAGEMRERLARSGLPGERMPIMTIHAFAAALLREYAARVPHALDETQLKPDFRILDEADAFLLAEDLLARFPLLYYRSLGNPTAHLRTLLADFSHARDELHTPDAYQALVQAMPPMPEGEAPSADRSDDSAQDGRSTRTTARHKAPHPPAGTYTREQIARARERAAAYAVWDRELRRRGLVDFGGLIQRAVELLRVDREALRDVRGRFPHLLVDEFQDTNHAAAELLLLLAGSSGTGLWVVGDRNQSIYRFRGAAPSNVRRLAERYPDLRVVTLRRCYRSVPAIVRLGSAMAARMAALAGGATDVDREDGGDERALAEAMRPLAMEPVRADMARPAIRRGDAFVSAAHERVGLAAAIKHERAAGYAYEEQAVLCRTHKQVRQVAAALAAEDVPVTQLGEFFDRPEIKDALMLVALAAGPDARGVLRAAPLLMGLGYPPPAASELAAAARALAVGHHILPQALCAGGALDRIAAVSATTRAGLIALGGVAREMWQSSRVGQPLAEFLLRPGGYAWHLLRMADGLETRVAGAEGQKAPPAEMERPARAQQALAALGELVRLAWRFDGRWAREPEFRARLSRAVTHWHSAPAAPDALEPVVGADQFPGADRLPDAETAMPGPTSDMPTAPAVRCFPHYLSALRVADVAVVVPAGEDNAVRVLTLHQSKGLEFPVVYLPGLARGEFPAGMTIHEEVCPPGFRESDTPDERAAEERCLFYVGVTRARDVLALTRAASYRQRKGKTAAASPKPAQPSPLLDLLADAPDWGSAAPLLLDDDLSHLLAHAVEHPDELADDEVDDEEDDEEAVGASMSLGGATGERPAFKLRELEQYLKCPRQYKYARDYQLLDPAQNAVYRFHRFVRWGRRTLQEVRAGAPGAGWPEAETRLRALWQAQGPAGHAYDAFYWQVAQAILRDDWRAIVAPAGEEITGRVLLAQPLRAELRRCVVEVTADRVLEGVAAAAPGDEHAPSLPLTVLMRLHTGRPHGDDQQDLTLPLYYLAHQQRHPGAPLRIVLAYVGRGLADGALDAEAPGPGDLMDVTEIARRGAEQYLKPERRQRSRLDKLDEAALAIAAGQFEPKPEERRCAGCAYCYVCPADPEGADTSAIGAPVASATPILPPV